MRLTLDHILIKDFLNTLESGDYSFISNKKKVQDKIAKKWDRLLAQYENLNGSRKISKEVVTNGRIESLYAKFKAINLACDILEFKKEDQAIEILKEHYFFIDEANYQKEIERIKSESQSILIQVEKLKAQLPEQENNKGKTAQHIDQVILGYCAFVGIQLKPNKCTVTEFIALKNLFLSKLKELQKPKAVKNGR